MASTPYSLPASTFHLARRPTDGVIVPSKISASSSSLPALPLLSTTTTRRLLLYVAVSFSTPSNATCNCWLKFAIAEFYELPGSGGVKALDIVVGSGESPVNGDRVAIHYYGRLAAKQGWRFDSTYDLKDDNGDSLPFVFIFGSGRVIPGIKAAVSSMKIGGIRRVIIPPSQGYQNTSQEPIPPNFFDRQRLFTTIFNPTRISNGEGSTLGTLVFDIELVSLGHQ